jgi:hypothetical protein
MAKTARPVPAALARVGITHIVDNVPAGCYIGGFEADFVRLFQADIVKKLFKTGGSHGKNSESVPGKPGIEGGCAGSDTGGPARRVRTVRLGQRKAVVREGAAEQGDVDRNTERS